MDLVNLYLARQEDTRRQIIESASSADTTQLLAAHSQAIIAKSRKQILGQGDLLNHQVRQFVG